MNRPLVLLLVVLLGGLSPRPARAADPRLEAQLDRAGLRQADLAFPLLSAERDSFRLQVVDEVLWRARPLDGWADSLLSEQGAGSTLSGRVERLQRELRRAGHPVAPRAADGAWTEPADWDGWIARLRDVAGTQLLDKARVRILEEDLGGLLQEDGGQDGRTVFEQDSLLRLAERESLARVRRLESLDLPGPAAWGPVLAELDGLLAHLDAFRREADGQRPQRHPTFGPVLYADERVAVGTEAVNTWKGALPAVVIDLGGDDLYEGAVAVSRGGVSWLIDLQGDDRYRGSGELGPAATVGGMAILVDLEGDDRYQGRFAAQGAALGGLAALDDRGGEDVYEAESFAQGAGSLGIGLLLDGAGHDLYRCSLYGQGFGHVAGLGLLEDASGHDQYLMQPRFVDEIRYEDHHLSMGQGFGFGQRPDLSGGIGLLRDLAGNDLYSADIFGQGGSYWWALGVLDDRAGNDRYLAWQYAQGAGVHLAAALLVDGAGQDVYQSRGVSQGCGHDLGLGWLLERDGDDSYCAWDLSQGAGSANGCGRLSDLAGNDLYAMRGPGKPRAYGDPRRRTGSLGLFLDAAGEDFYLGPGRNDSLWSGSLRGLGQDWGARHASPVGESLAPAAEAAGEEPLDSLFRVDDSVDHLYVWAIRLEPKWQRERDLARAELARRPAECLELIQRNRLMGSEISWERHALKDIVVSLGAAVVPLLDSAVAAFVPLEDGPERTRRRAERGFALWVFSEAPKLGQGERFAQWWNQGLLAEEPGAQALLLESLASRGGPQAPLLEGLAHPKPGVRRSAAWGLGQQPSVPASRKALVAALADSMLVVRMAAFESLARDSLLDGRELEAALFDPARPAVQRRELLRLLARRDGRRARQWLARLEADPVLAAELPWVKDSLPPAEAAPSGRRRGRR